MRASYWHAGGLGPAFSSRSGQTCRMTEVAGRLSGWRIPDLQCRLRHGRRAAGRHRPAPGGGPAPGPRRAAPQGVIYVFRIGDGAFSASDRQILASFADQAAIAVHNAQLYERLSQEKQRLDAILEHTPTAC